MPCDIIRLLWELLELLDHVLSTGSDRSDRTGTGTRSVFGAQLRFSLNPNFPLLTTKKLHLRSIIYELLWFLKGDTNIAYLNENKVTFGTNGLMAKGDLGRLRSPMDRLEESKVSPLIK